MVTGAFMATAAGTNNAAECVFRQSHERMRTISYSSAVAISLLCIAVIFYSYVRIFRSIKASIRPHPLAHFTGNELQNYAILSNISGRKQRMMKTTKSMLLVTLYFMVSQSISMIASVIKATVQTESNIYLLNGVYLCTKIYLTNNFANPFIYFWLNKEFRQNVLKILKCNGTRR
jgi:hypothetical protein